MLRKKIVGLLLPALAVSQMALSQPAAQAGQKPHWPKVDLNVVVVDKSGQPQGSLDKSAFHVFENGTERPIDSVAAGDAPISLALLIDTSGSTYGNRDTVAAVATAVIRSLPPGSEVMAVLFSNIAFIDLPFTPAQPAPVRFLERLDSRGATAFYDALVATENHIAANAKNPRRAIVVLSDGSDNASTLNLAQAIRRIQEEPDAPTVYFVGMPEPRAHFNERFRSHRIIELLTSRVGGVEIAAGKDLDAAGLSARVAALIRSQFVISFTAAGAPDDRYRKLEVRVDPANLEIHALQGYFAAAQ